jgi:hypothetical protein
MNPLELRTSQEGKNMTSCTNECKAAESNNWTSARGKTASRKQKCNETMITHSTQPDKEHTKRTRRDHALCLWRLPLHACTTMHS